MSRVKLDSNQQLTDEKYKELYEITYAAVNGVHYDKSQRKRGDVSVIMAETRNARLGAVGVHAGEEGTYADFDFELHMVQGSDDWPIGEHDVVKVELNKRAGQISQVLACFFPEMSHAVIDNGGRNDQLGGIEGTATGFVTMYEGNGEPMAIRPKTQLSARVGDNERY